MLLNINNMPPKPSSIKILRKEVQAILPLYFQINMSDAFLACAGNQLTELFVSLTKIPIKDYVIRIGWDSNTDQLNYTQAPTSSFQAFLYFKYGKMPLSICWKSISGKIYGLQDIDIDCNDLLCWMEGLDVERAKFLQKPAWSLFTFPEVSAYTIKVHPPYRDISLSFIRCADTQLTPIFEKMVGFTVNKEVCINLNNNQEFSYIKDVVSRLAVTFYVNHNWNPHVFICWKSNSGRVYDIAEDITDCSDMVFWLEGVDPVLYNKQMFPGQELPFKLKALSFKLVITRLNMDMTISMTLKPDKEQMADDVMIDIDQFITHFNERSEEKQRKDGVIHNWHKNLEKGKIIYEIDTGFTGATFLKKFLQYLSGRSMFDIVEVS